MIGYSQAFEGLYGPKPIEGKNKMNERIRELAHEAGFFPEPNWDHTGWHAAGHNDTFEKFAELIVRECGDALKKDMELAHSQLMTPLVYDIALQVLEHEPTLETWTFTNSQLQHLARLIVQECIDVSQVGTMTQARLKKHFGVEE